MTESGPLPVTRTSGFKDVDTSKLSVSDAATFIMDLFDGRCQVAGGTIRHAVEAILRGQRESAVDEFTTNLHASAASIGRIR